MGSAKRKTIMFLGGILACVFGYFSFYNRGEIEFPLKEKVELESPYIVRDYGNYRYVLDKQRTRILVIDKETNVIKTLLPKNKNQGDTFYYADDFLVDSKGFIYVKEGAWDGNRISREAVLLYDENGEYVRTYIDREYSSKVNKHKIMLLSVENQKIIYAVKEDKRIIVIEHNMETGTEDKNNYSFQDAFDYVNDMARSKDGRTFMLDKAGRIFELIDENNELNLVYKAGEDEFPNWIEVSQSGSLLFADLYSDSVRELNLQTLKTSTILEKSGAVTVTPVRFSELANPEKNSSVIKKQILVLVVFILFILCCVNIFLMLLVSYFKSNPSVTKRITIYIILIIMIVSGTITFKLTSEFSKVMKGQILAQMENLAYSVANSIRPATLDSIHCAADFASPAYREMIESMENIIDANLDINRSIYCDIFKYDEKHGGYACAYLDQAIGTYFPITPGETEEIKHIYETSQIVSSNKDDTSASYTYVSVPVINDSGRVCGVVSVMTENFMLTDQINAMKKSVLLGIVVTLIFVWLLIGELLSYIMAKSKARMDLAESEQNGVKKKIFPYYYIRLMVFILFAAYNLTTTFLPMVIAKSAIDSLGEYGSGIAAALPISINLFIIGLMAVFCEELIRRIGCKKVVVIGTMLSALSNLIVFAFPSEYILVFFALVIDGIGVGLTTNAMYLMVSQIEDGKNRASGYAAYNAAQVSGINFGMLAGAALATSLSRRMIFPVVTIMWIFSAIVFLLFWKTIGFSSSSNSAESENLRGKKNGPKRILAFLAHRRIWSFIFFVQIPFALMGSFVYYYLPIYSDVSGMSEILVAVLMMVYSMFAIYLGSSLTKLVMGKTGIFSPYASILLSAVVVIVYASMQNFTGLLIAIFVLGLANGFGRSVHQANFSMLEECENYGVPDAMGIFNFTDFIGQSFGPTVMALVFLSKSVKLSALVFSIILVCFCVIHVIITLTGKKLEGSVND